MRMATYNNQHWLLSHVRNSFISTDDTGMCEAVMLSEDLPNQYVANLNQKYSSKFPNKAEEYLCYPGLLENDDDDDALSQSYDIQMDQDMGCLQHQRQRSNTAQKLEKMDLARRKASKIKNIKCDDSAVSVTNANVVQNDYLFVKKELSPSSNDDEDECDGDKVHHHRVPIISLLSEQLLKCPKQPQNKFIEYARFDGTAQTGIATKTMKIFLTMLPERLRNYPLQICVTSTAKIQEFIGLICYKCSIAYPDIQLNSVKNYGLYITEEDGEVDMDFPALDLREPCSKFCFAHLALVERKYHDSLVSHSSSRFDYDNRALSITSESDLNKMIAESKAQDEQQNEAMAKMLGHTTMMEAPLYQSYRVFILNKSLFKAEIQLGISGEKIEIDPIQPKNNRFWSKQKAVSHSMESIAWCELIESKASRATFRIVYSLMVNTPFQQSNTMGVMPESPLQSSSSFKHYDFETDPTTAHEIVDKINNILELKTSSCRRDIYKNLGPKDKKKLLKLK